MDCCTPTSSVAVAEPPVATPETPSNGSKSRTGRIRTIALIGPPNCGKSTLFNRLTGMRQKVANYPGVTVEHHSGTMKSFGRPDLTSAPGPIDGAAVGPVSSPIGEWRPRRNRTRATSSAATTSAETAEKMATITSCGTT